MGCFVVCYFFYYLSDCSPESIIYLPVHIAFMRQYYTVFNYVDQTIGFAKAVKA